MSDFHSQHLTANCFLPISPCYLTSTSSITHSLFIAYPPQKQKSSKMYHHYQPPLLGHFGHPHILSLLTPPFSQQTVTNTNNAPTRGRFWTHPFPLSIYYLAYSIYTHRYQPLTTFPLPFPLPLLLSLLLLLLLLLSSLFSSRLPLPSIYLSTHLPIYPSLYLPIHQSISNHRVPEFRSCTGAVIRAFCSSLSFA